VRRAGPAVEGDERRGRRRVTGPQLAGHPVPRLRLLAVDRKGDRALAYVHLAASLRLGSAR